MSEARTNDWALSMLLTQLYEFFGATLGCSTSGYASNPTPDCAVRTAIGILGGRPPIGSAYRLKLGSSGRDDGCSRAAFVIKNQGQKGRDGGDIFIGYPKGRSGQPDFFDGESELLLINGHKPRGVGLRGGREGGGGNVLVDSVL